MPDSSLERVFQAQPNLLRLRSRSKDYLQVLLNRFSLKKTPAGRQLEISLSDELFSIADRQGKREFNAAIKAFDGSGRQQLVKELRRFDHPSLLGYQFNCGNHPLRWANGGVLPIMRLDGEDYFCLFYRDAFPVGWNIANGASDTVEELLDPSRVALRQFGEELLIVHTPDAADETQDPVVFAFDPGQENRPSGYQREALRAWSPMLGLKNLDRCQLHPLPLKWIDGPDQVRVTFGLRSYESSGYFLNVTPEDNAIEVDRLALINLSSDMQLLDGECYEGKNYNRIIGLFPVDAMKKDLDAKEHRPAKFYFSGTRTDAEKLEAKQLADLLDGTVKQYLTGLAKSKLRKRADAREYWKEAPRFDLCPITRAVIRRYFDWRSPDGDLQPQPERDEVHRQIAKAGNSEIFISHKSDDDSIARWLCEYLHQRKHRVFFSPETIRRLGDSDYSAAINAALETATCLIVVATHPAHVSSGWVKYEWSSFCNEIRSGRKQGEVFTFVNNIDVADLPYELRGRQMVPYSPTSPHDSFACLYEYIANALTKARH